VPDEASAARLQDVAEAVPAGQGHRHVGAERHEPAALGLRLLGPLALGDVAEDQDRPDRVPRPVPDGRGAVVDGPFGPVAGDEDRVVGQPHDRPLRRARSAGSRPAGGWLVDDAEDLGRGRPAASALVHPVSDSATPLRNVTRPSASVLMTASPMLEQRDPQPLRLLPQRVLGALARQEYAPGVLQGDGAQQQLLLIARRHQRPPSSSDARAVPSTRARIFANAVSRVVGRVVAERREAAVVGRAQLLDRDVLGRLEDPVADFLRGLDARVDRRDDADEDPLARLDVGADDLQDAHAVVLAGQGDVEIPPPSAGTGWAAARRNRRPAVGRVAVAARGRYCTPMRLRSSAENRASARLFSR
jgi:hypothetical protein